MAYVPNWEKIVEEGKVPIYQCASKNLKNFLLMNDCIYIDTYKSTKTKRTIWAFVKTKKVEDLLKKWTENNPNKKNKDVLNPIGEDKTQEKGGDA